MTHCLLHEPFTCLAAAENARRRRCKTFCRPFVCKMRAKCTAHPTTCIFPLDALELERAQNLKSCPCSLSIYSFPFIAAQIKPFDKAILLSYTLYLLIKTRKVFFAAILKSMKYTIKLREKKYIPTEFRYTTFCVNK